MRKTALALLIAIATLILGFSPTPVGAGTEGRRLVSENGRGIASPGPSFFAAVNSPGGIAFTTSSMLVTQVTRDRVLSISSAGVVTTFATLPSTGNIRLERYIAVSSGLGDCPLGYVYVTVGKDVYQITPDGLTVTLLAVIPSLSHGRTGITFDDVGTFGFKMVLTDPTGPVWTLDCAGAVTQLADIGQPIEGPAVVPMSFVPVGGDILVAGDSSVFAISPSGTVSTAFNMGGGEQVVFVPSRACNYGSSGGGYFVNMEGMNEIVKFPARQLKGLGGTVLLTAEIQTNIWDSAGGLFWGPIGTPDLEGSALAPCPRGRPAGDPVIGPAQVVEPRS